MKLARVVFGALAFLTVILEIVGIRRPGDGLTISEGTRACFRVETPVGRAAFLLSWLGFAAWFARHILRYPR